MAGDARSTTSVRRANSVLSGHSSLTLQPRTAVPAEPVEAVSAHVTDPFLHEFLQSSFDAATYWNATLRTSKPKGTTATAEQAALAQTALSQLAAHTTRLTTVLSQLTDEILRSGSRLAYEVELLRGETIGLAEVLERVGEGVSAAGDKEDDPSAPPALAQLRMLAQVRARLDAVIRTFDEAMKFAMPPSAMSVSASFLSVSGPEVKPGEPGGTSTGAAALSPSASLDTTKSLEEKGQQMLRARREEVARLLEGKDGDNGGETVDGLDAVEAAGARVAALRDLCQVWAGTAEEKARLKFVDGLQRMVEDRQRQLEREKQAEEQAAAAAAAEAAAAAKPAKSNAGRGGGSATGPAASASPAQDTASSASSTASQARGGYATGYGFISQLQKIRGGL